MSEREYVTERKCKKKICNQYSMHECVTESIQQREKASGRVCERKIMGTKEYATEKVCNRESM